MRNLVARSVVCALVVVSFVTAAAASAIAPAPLGSLATSQGAGVTPGPLVGVGIAQKLGSQLPLDATFHDDEGNVVHLSDYFGPGKKPAVLAMAYYECPMLCTLVLNGMIKALRPLSFTAGDEFDVIAISINPKDTPDLAKKKKASYIESYQRKADGHGFHFLTGDEANIKAVADAIGFQYRYIPETGEYAHAAAIYVATPLGQVSRYFFGVEYSTRDLRLAFVEAADGKIGNVVDQLMLFCYRYDPTMGKYDAQALAIVRLAGVATVLSLAGYIGISRWRETHPSSTRS
ncbi:MAG TPA: SCO family protein [Candidatus Binatia bacterium]|jgi:protein SCO1/2